MSFRRDWLIAAFCLLALLGVFAGLGVFVGAPETLRTVPRYAAGSAVDAPDVDARDVDVHTVALTKGDSPSSETRATVPAGEGFSSGALSKLAVFSPSGSAAAESESSRPVAGAAPKPPLPPAARILPALSAADQSELRCLALNIYFEARSEPLSGQIAVAHVVLNRVGDRAFPATICGVVRQGGDRRRHRCQFSWWCDGRSDQPREEAAWRQSLQLAHAIFNGQLADPTEGAKWYHAIYVRPDWRVAFRRGPRIGRHIFYQRTS